jgi:hypothetical protein
MKWISKLFKKDVRETKWMSREEFEAVMTKAAIDVYDKIPADQITWTGKREVFTIGFTSGAALAMNMIHDYKESE